MTETKDHIHDSRYEGYSSIEDVHIYVCACGNVKKLDRNGNTKEN